MSSPWRPSRRRLARVFLTTTLGLLALLLVACGGGDGGSVTGGSIGGGGVTPSAGIGPGISVTDALGSTLDGPLLVNGTLFVSREGEVRLCALLLESFPPQCGQPSLLIEGFDLASADGLSTEQGVTWSDDVFQILGDVRDGVLTVSGTSQG